MDGQINKYNNENPYKKIVNMNTEVLEDVSAIA